MNCLPNVIFGMQLVIVLHDLVFVCFFLLFLDRLNGGFRLMGFDRSQRLDFLVV